MATTLPATSPLVTRWSPGSGHPAAVTRRWSPGGTRRYPAVTHRSLTLHHRSRRWHPSAKRTFTPIRQTTTLRRYDAATLRRCDAATQRRDDAYDATMPRRDDATTRRRYDATTLWRYDATTLRRGDDAVTTRHSRRRFLSSRLRRTTSTATCRSAGRWRQRCCGCRATTRASGCVTRCAFHAASTAATAASLQDDVAVRWRHDDVSKATRVTSAICPTMMIIADAVIQTIQ